MISILIYALSGILSFYIYALLSNPQRTFFSLTKRNYTNYKFFNLRLRRFESGRPRNLPKILFFIPLLREAILILLRRNNSQNNNQLNYDQIYTKICKKRFNPRYPYLTSGDHFSSFYPRNLGFFYSRALNFDTVNNLTDYQNRIAIYLNSLDFALDFYNGVKLTTTIVPVFRSVFYASNIYKSPIDTLCSLLLSFDYLINPDDNFVSMNSEENYKQAQNQGRVEAQKLLEEYELDLYEKTLDLLSELDISTALLNSKKSYSGIRDGVIRYTCFYDNVCLWKTIELALKLEIITRHELDIFEKPENLKLNILNHFVENNTILNELNPQEKDNNYSADWLVAFSLGFLSCDNQSELELMENTLTTFKLKGLIHPLGIQYSKKNPTNTFWLVKVFAPDYMGKTIWSHWSVELGHLMLAIYQKTQNLEYKEYADNLINITTLKILETGGYPELYDLKYSFYKNKFYSSIIQTGWMVNFEHLRQVNNAVIDNSKIAKQEILDEHLR